MPFCKYGLRTLSWMATSARAAQASARRSKLLALLIGCPRCCLQWVRRLLQRVACVLQLGHQVRQGRGCPNIDPCCQRLDPGALVTESICKPWIARREWREFARGPGGPGPPAGKSQERLSRNNVRECVLSLTIMCFACARSFCDESHEAPSEVRSRS